MVIFCDKFLFSYSDSFSGHIDQNWFPGNLVSTHCCCCFQTLKMNLDMFWSLHPRNNISSDQQDMCDLQIHCFLQAHVQIYSLNEFSTWSWSWSVYNPLINESKTNKIISWSSAIGEPVQATLELIYAAALGSSRVKIIVESTLMSSLMNFLKN